MSLGKRQLEWRHSREEADADEEREYYARMRDAWITLANRCEFMPISDVKEPGK